MPVTGAGLRHVNQKGSHLNLYFNTAGVTLVQKHSGASKDGAIDLVCRTRIVAALMKAAQA